MVKAGQGYRKILKTQSVYESPNAIIFKVGDSFLSIENFPSETARKVALNRALSWMDERADVKGSDFLAQFHNYLMK